MSGPEANHQWELLLEINDNDTQAQSVFTFTDYVKMSEILHIWQDAGKNYAMNASCETLFLNKDEHIIMSQVFYNASGIWYLGFLTNRQNTKLFESPNWVIPEDNSNSDVKTYAVD